MPPTKSDFAQAREAGAAGALATTMSGGACACVWRCVCAASGAARVRSREAAQFCLGSSHTQYLLASNITKRKETWLAMTREPAPRHQPGSARRFAAHLTMGEPHPCEWGRVPCGCPVRCQPRRFNFGRDRHGALAQPSSSVPGSGSSPACRGQHGRVDCPKSVFCTNP